RELQNGIALIARQPHVVLRVHRHAMHRRRPFVAGARTTPRRNDVALGIELEDRRRDLAADIRTAALVARLRWRRAAGLLGAVRARKHAGLLRRNIAAMG